MKTTYEKIKYRFIIFPLVRFIRIFSNAPLKLSPAPFFILGSGRNGSTLLASILNAHKDVLVPPEQFVLPYAIMKRYLSIFRSKDAWRDDIIRMFYKESKTLNWTVNLDDINIKEKNVSYLFDKIYLKYASKSKGSINIWGDKTPLNIHFINLIYPEFINAKYIFLIRDVRDVALSYKKLYNHKASDTSYAIWKWKDSINRLRYLQKRTDVLVIKYEELVSQPQQQINRILDYLGIPKDDTLIKSKTDAHSMGVGAQAFHQNLNQPISKRSIGKWKEDLSDDDIDLLHKKCSKYLIDFGYNV